MEENNIQQTNQQSPIPLVTPPPKKPFRFNILMAIIFLCAGLSVGFFLGNSQIIQKFSFSFINSKPTPSPIPFPETPPADLTADWKTYTNIAQSFSFRYPGDYFKFQQEYPNIGIYLAPSQGEGGNGPKFLKSDDVWLEATILSGANLKSLDEYLTLPGQQIYPTNSKKIPTTIGGVSGYIIDYNFPASAGDITEYSKVGIVLRNEIIYTIRLSAWNQEVLQTNQTMFDQILSTFKFLEEPSVTPKQNYVCPQTEWVNCMPGPNAEERKECTSEFLNWAKTNCPNFQGGAL